MSQIFHDFDLEEGVFFQKGLIRNTEFEKKYLALREKEKRIYTDEQLARLPYIDPSHPLSQEWAIRKQSADQLIKYLKSKRQQTILEVGCGNGWLIRYIHASVRAQCCGLDVNETELKQAVKVFGDDSSLVFLYADIFSLTSDKPHADVIILASVIQYFPNVQTLLTGLFKLLQPGGQIHILDSPLYNESDIVPARLRSNKYFSDLGQTEMPLHYFHHTLKSLNEFKPSLLYNPMSLTNRILRKIRNDSPFPWVALQK